MAVSMKLLPGNKYAFSSPMQVEDAIRALKNITEPSRPIAWGFNNGFVGTVDGQSFLIRHITFSYWVDWRPELVGTIEADGDGSIVRVETCMPQFIALFWHLWMGIGGLIFAVGMVFLVTALFSAGQNPPELFFFMFPAAIVAIVGFGYGFMRLTFWAEETAGIQRLCDTLRVHN